MKKAQVTAVQFSTPDKKVFRRVRRNSTYLIAHLTISSLKEALNEWPFSKEANSDSAKKGQCNFPEQSYCLCKDLLCVFPQEDLWASPVSYCASACQGSKQEE